MAIEDLVAAVRASSPETRATAIFEIAGLAGKTKNKEKFNILLKALNYSANNDPNTENRNMASKYVETLKKNMPKFEKNIVSQEKPNRKKIPYSKPILLVILIVMLALGYSFLTDNINLDFLNQGERDLTKVKETNVEDLLNPLGVETVKSPDEFRAFDLSLNLKMDDVKRSHVEDYTFQYSGGKEIAKVVIKFDLLQKVLRAERQGKTLIQYTTKNVISPVPLAQVGYPEPGKILNKLLAPDGTVLELSGDLKNLIPAYAFANKYIMPVKPVKVGGEWTANLEKEELSVLATYKLEKIIKVKGNRFFFITFTSSSRFDSLAFKTFVEQKSIGEIYLDYNNKLLVFSKEVAIINIKKPDSRIGMEIKNIKTEVFSDAVMLLGR